MAGGNPFDPIQPKCKSPSSFPHSPENPLPIQPIPNLQPSKIYQRKVSSKRLNKTPHQRRKEKSPSTPRALGICHSRLLLIPAIAHHTASRSSKPPPLILAMGNLTIILDQGTARAAVRLHAVVCDRSFEPVVFADAGALKSCEDD